MSNYYDLNDIKNAISNDIEKHEAFLKAWENVTFPTKKKIAPYTTQFSTL